MLANIRKVFVPISFDLNSVVTIVMVALAYIVAARISQVFAIEPGNITPVWIPSGLMLALALKLGSKVWPGVFAGAFIGNVWAYISTESFARFMASVLSGAMNGIGDVISIVLMALIINKLTKKEHPLTTLNDFAIFGLFGVIIGPFCSSVFGITGLLAFGFLPNSDYLFALSNWWIGDAVGALLFTPFFYSLITRHEHITRYFFPVLLFSLFVFGTFTAMMFELLNMEDWMIQIFILLLPVAFIFMLQQGQQTVFIVQVVVATIAVVATHQQLGPFAEYEQVTPLMSLQLFVAGFSCVIFALALLVNQKQTLNLKLEKQKASLEQLYRQDSLTGLWNRYRIEEFLQHELNRFHRNSHGFSVFMIDIDDFKKVNDTYGHLEGDRILKELSAIIQKQTRKVDLAGRWGGEEFIIVSPEPEEKSASIFAEKVRCLIEHYDFKLHKSLTVSIGFTTCLKEDTQTTIVERADQALYEAKSAGKNRVCYKI